MGIHSLYKILHVIARSAHHCCYAVCSCNYFFPNVVQSYSIEYSAKFQKFPQLSDPPSSQSYGLAIPPATFHVMENDCQLRRRRTLSLVRGVHVVILALDLWEKEIRVLRHVTPSRCGEASSKPRALSWDRAQAIGAPGHGFSN